MTWTRQARQRLKALPQAQILPQADSASGSDSIEAKIDKGSLTNGNAYNVFFEINHSFDYNEYWNEDNSGVNGQPSLIYRVQFVAGQPCSISLVPIGHGSVNGSDGNITGGLRSITSALNIVKDISLIGK